MLTLYDITKRERSFYTLKKMIPRCITALLLSLALLLTAGCAALENILPGNRNQPTSTPTLMPTPDNSFFDTLTDEQRQLLSQLEAALRAHDYQTAFDIQSSAAFHAIGDVIPEPGWFSYYPDDEATVFVRRGEREGFFSYHMDMFVGRDGEGVFIGSRYGGYQNYAMHIAEYAEGRANGPFRWHIFNFAGGATGFHIQRGYMRDGEPFGPVYIENEAGTFEREYEPEWFNWKPPWPEGR